MERMRVNIAVGFFVVLGILALGYLSIKLGRVSFLGGGGYLVAADFPSVGGLKPGAWGAATLCPASGAWSRSD